MEGVKAPPPLPLRQTQELPLGLFIQVEDVAVLEVGQSTLTATAENGSELVLPVPAAGRGDREGEVANLLHAVLAVHILGGGEEGTLRDSEGGTVELLQSLVSLTLTMT